MCNQCREQQEMELLPEFEAILNGEYGFEFESGGSSTVSKTATAVSMVDPKKVSCATYNKSYPVFKVMGTTDPPGGGFRKNCKTFGSYAG